MNYLNKLIICFILAMVIGVTTIKMVHAEDSIGILLVSKHFSVDNCKQWGTVDTPCHFNEKNLGISYQSDIKGKWYLSLGSYYNSFYRLSNRIGYGYRLKYGGVDVGAVTGYPMGYVIPSVVTYITIPVDDTVSVQLLMPFMVGNTQVLALQLKIKL